MQRHLFPGGNTAVGFYSYYEHILPVDEVARMVILKGGPGVGKSTFMKRMGACLEACGQMVEHLHCSSDPDSLDGIVCRAMGFAMLDGTAPHIVDPEIPGAADSILNLGIYLNEQAMAPHKGEIRKLKTEISAAYQRAYRRLASALPIRQDSTAILSHISDEVALQAALAPWLETLSSGRTAKEPGTARCLFASAITPKGCVHYLDTLALPRLWRIQGVWGSEAHLALSQLRHAARLYGYSVEALFCPVQPDRIEHLIIPELSLMITTDNRYHHLNQPAEQTLDLDQCRTRALTTQEHDILAYNETTFDAMVEKACQTLSQAKALHDELELLYIPQMDFSGVERCFNETLERVLTLL